MRKDFGAQPWTYPMPVFIIAAYDEDGRADAMNAAWGGICKQTKITMCLTATHKTVKNILEKKAFTVSMGDAAHVTECDYLGIVSGNDVPDKLERSGLHTSRSAHVDAPLIDELPMAIECELVTYEPDTGRLVGEIINVCADESILNEKGNIDPSKLKPITYDPVNHDYLVLGEKVGNAFADGEKLK